MLQPKREPAWYMVNKERLERARQIAELVKSVLQMLIGLIIVLIVLVTLLASILKQGALTDLQAMENVANTTLRTAGVGLIFSTAIELAYLLYTDGPDEALTPVTTGFAALLLLRFPTGFDDIAYARIIEIAVYALGIALSIWVRGVYFKVEADRILRAQAK